MSECEAFPYTRNSEGVEWCSKHGREQYECVNERIKELETVLRNLLLMIEKWLDNTADMWPISIEEGENVTGSQASVGEEMKERAEILDERRKNLCAICNLPEIDGFYDETHVFKDQFGWVTLFSNPLDYEWLKGVAKQGHPFMQKGNLVPFGKIVWKQELR